MVHFLLVKIRGQHHIYSFADEDALNMVMQYIESNERSDIVVTYGKLSDKFFQEPETVNDLLIARLSED